jgi:formylglycine-generating enzyme required for sulfatase activity
MVIDSEFLLNLDALNILLIREKMAHSPDVWLNIHQLLASRAMQGRLPNTAEELTNLLSPLVCKNPQQQYRMMAVINEWLSGQKTATVQAQISSPEQSTAMTWSKRIRQFNRRSLYGFAVLLLLLIGLAFAIVYRPPDSDPKPLPTTPDTSTKIDVTAPTQTVPITDRVAPNPLPMPEQLPANWQRWQQGLGWAIPSLPIWLAVLWLVWHYRKRTVLRNQAPQGEKLLSRLTMNIAKDSIVAPFTGPEFVRAVAKLLHPVWTDSRHLHIEDSVIATANNSGFFTPRYRQQHSRAECLILVQSIHGNDQAAAFAELLVTALQQQKVDIRSYRFRDDPRRLIPWIQPLHGADTVALSLTQLAQKRADARLIVISDWDILFQPYQPDRPQPWIKDFENWQRRVWLSSGYENEAWAKRATKQSQQLNFRLLPLAEENIADMVQWLQQDGKRRTPLGNTGDDREHLPAILSETSDSWLDWRPPHNADLNRLCNELKAYLGEDGFLLLQALAVFPKPLSPLPQVLDIQLFAPPIKPQPKWQWRLPSLRNIAIKLRIFPFALSKSKSEWKNSRPEVTTKPDSQLRSEREQRLQRISRLPWSRLAYMPDYLRERLIKQLTRKNRQQIRKAWTALLDGLTSDENPEKLSLPIAVSKTSKQHLKNLFATEPKNSAINDPIFANILQGGKLGLLDFSLPCAFARLLPNTDKWLDLRPAVAVAVLTIMSVWGLNYAWQSYAKHALIPLWQQRIEQQNTAWQVMLDYQSDTQQLSDTLAKSLQAMKFPVTQQQTANKPTPAHNRISYATGGQAQAEQVAQKLSWYSYEATIDLEEKNDLTANTLQIQLNQTYQHTAGFNDTLRYAYSPPKENNTSPKPIAKLIEPEMITIKAGSFIMGSPDNEAGRYKNESPQHKVTITKAFAIGKYEVTFEQYDQFAEATSRKLPDDQGWGRGKRPVINVSFTDAQAYTNWLSQQTNKTYRLPSEAEWEYAARADTKTAFFWGDNVDKTGDFAWFSDNSDNKTQPVGEKKPNEFGLYDTAGNAWEWTQDCWHENYTFAPNDGSAWLESQGGNCNDRRVFRGGARYSIPVYLRSAIRGGFNTNPDGLLGFRIARAL